MLDEAPVYGLPYTFNITLVDQTDTKKFKAAPTLAAGDFKISKDGGAFANLATLPTVTPSGGRNVTVVLDAGEMTAKRSVVEWVDAAGAEWCDGRAEIAPGAGTGILEVGVAQAVSSSGLTLASTSSYAAADLPGKVISILSATTGAGQAMVIASYNNSTKVIVVDPVWGTALTGTVVYAIMWAPSAPVANVPDVNVKTITTDAITAASLKADGITKIRDGLLNWIVFTGYNLAKMLRVHFTLASSTTTGREPGSLTEINTAPADGWTVTITYDAGGNKVGFSTTASGTP